MTWFKVDDKFHAHPKVLALRMGGHEDAAIALWVKAGSWCAAHLTNGVVPEYALGMLASGDAADAAEELVRVGLWVKAAGGYRFKSWGEYQPSKSDVETRRRKNSEKVATWRDRQRSHATPPKPPCNQVTHTDVTDGVTTPVTLPPTRPDPSVLRTEYERASEPEKPLTELLVRQTFARAYEQAHGAPWPMSSQTKPEEVRAIAAWVDDLAKRDSLDPEVIVRRLVRHWTADPWVERNRRPWKHFAKHFSSHWQAPKPAAAASSNEPEEGEIFSW